MANPTPNRRRPRQLELRRKPPATWGGWRPGAGRPRKPGAEQKVARERFSRPAVVHVTAKVHEDVPNLRAREVARKVAVALWLGARREDFRLVHFSIQSNHLHLIVEASDWRALSRGIHALSVRVARAVNRAAERKGKVFAQRYHAHILRTPTQVRNALRYVLNNRRRHQGQRQAHAGWVDPLSTACWFDGYRDREPNETNPWPTARTFLLTTGWRRGRGGRFSVNDIPGKRR
ncbi:MAG: transposase [Myxococcales bacterium]|nr:transposase [Myxococcales bacterium]